MFIFLLLIWLSGSVVLAEVWDLIWSRVLDMVQHLPCTKNYTREQWVVQLGIIRVLCFVILPPVVLMCRMSGRY